MRIMIVESDWHFEAMATRYFESHADQIIHETPTSAVAHAISWKPDVVILAAEFASEDMLDALQALNCRPAVLITEHMSRFDRAWTAWQRGGDELLMKPVLHAKELHEAARMAMEHAALYPTWTARPRAASA